MYGMYRRPDHSEIFFGDLFLRIPFFDQFFAFQMRKPSFVGEHESKSNGLCPEVREFRSGSFRPTAIL